MIDDLPNLNRQVFAVKRLERAFTETLEAIRRLDVRCAFDTHERGGGKRVFVPLCSLCRIIGIRVPEPSVEDVVLWNFAKNQLGIAVDDIWGFGEYYVATNVVPFLINRMGLHPEIARRLTDWFQAFCCERELASPWDMPCTDESFGSEFR